MAQPLCTFETAHTGALHDAQLDYYGKRLATSSSDHTIRLWDVSSEFPAFLAELHGHAAPVWQVAWAHPKFGNLLASCSYDKKVLVWKETQPNQWVTVFSGEDHTASVNSLDWAPWEMGLHLATASSDGTVCVWSYNTSQQWSKKKFIAHSNGVNGISWSPSSLGTLCASSTASGRQGHVQMNSTAGDNFLFDGPGGLNAGLNAEMRDGILASAGGQGDKGTSLSTDGVQFSDEAVLQLATGGCDNQVRIWRFEKDVNEWKEAYQMMDHPHTEWVRDVAWRPNIGLTSQTIASCSEDFSVILWSQDSSDPNRQQWRNIQSIQFDAPVWRVSWSVTGTVLAVASGDSSISLFKENIDGGKWEKVTQLSGQAQMSGVMEESIAINSHSAQSQQEGSFSSLAVDGRVISNPASSLPITHESQAINHPYQDHSATGQTDASASFPILQQGEQIDSRRMPPYASIPRENTFPPNYRSSTYDPPGHAVSPMIYNSMNPAASQVKRAATEFEAPYGSLPNHPPPSAFGGSGAVNGHPSATHQEYEPRRSPPYLMNPPSSVPSHSPPVSTQGFYTSPSSGSQFPSANSPPQVNTRHTPLSKVSSAGYSGNYR
ncbi:WD domain, G-beta repeat-containing protein [Cardiosporidium cionae]|uniref:WD domain, G-beta repeat-containing protein n=1 Tax=Cardiosporidium cionae TaxID=476202 RepID=A0ABQ7JE99_9APIC|nr:WD domain, G-beta repeat-containing protein [Cardiosporidium cionae]|eukprot:KAF8822337.1 WD domain, G-beta repeat-containing protein [Cardiosporidium cionae]